MAKRSKFRSSTTSVGHGQSMRLRSNFPQVPILPTLSAEAKWRLHVLDFANKHGVALAVDAYVRRFLPGANALPRGI